MKLCNQKIKCLNVLDMLDMFQFKYIIQVHHLYKKQAFLFVQQFKQNQIKFTTKKEMN